MPNLDAGFLILNEWIPAFRSLTGDECKTLLLALIDRQQKGVPIPDFGDTVLGVFAQMIEPTIKRRLDGQKGGKKDTTQVPTIGTIGGTTIGTTVDTSEGRRDKNSIYNNTLSNERVNAHTRTREKKPKFVPPTLEEVVEYCKTKGYKIDPEKFYNHYTANGWMVGKNPMKDWKAAVRNWEKNDGVFARNVKERGNGVSADRNSSFNVDEFFEAAVKRSYGTDVPI